VNLLNLQQEQIKVKEIVRNNMRGLEAKGF